jgi:hypothetical protein
MLFNAGSMFAGEQPVFSAPWAGTATITQGNRSTCSHNEAVFRTCLGNSTAWENTWALDIQKVANNVPVKFDVLAPADGTVALVIDDPQKRLGGRELWLNVVGPTGKTFQLVFMHLSEIKLPYKTNGATVRRGDVIAVAGNTTSGEKIGIHLHMHIFSGPPAAKPDASPHPDSHTQPIEQLRMIAAGETTTRIYESKGDGSDDPLKMSLNDDLVKGKTFTSDNGQSAPPPAPPPADLLKNGFFETIKTPTNVAPDGSWLRSSYSGTSFNTLTGGGTWGHNGSSAYAYLGVNNNSTQVVDSVAFVVPSAATAADLRFWVSIVTLENTTTMAYDKLTFSLVDASTGAQVASLGYMSNLSATGAPTAYVNRQWPVTLSTLRGRLVRLRMAASCDSSLSTTWRVDDLSLITR